MSRASCKTSILAVHPGALGDVILFGHLLSRLGGRTTLVTGGQKGRLLAGAGVVAAALDFDALPMHEVFGDAPLKDCRLPVLLGRHDRLISCFAAQDTAAGQRLAAMGGCTDATFLPVRPAEGFRGHLLDLWADLLGLRPSGRQDFPAWSVPAAWRAAARDELRKLGLGPRRPFIVMHPGSGAAAKCWKLDRFETVARSVGHGPIKTNVVFVLGPVEADRWSDKVVSSLAARFPTLVSPPLTTLTGLLASAAGYLGNDSGISHLAAAVGIPAGVIFGPTRSEHFAPLGKCVRTIAARNMNVVIPDEISEALQKLMEVTEYS